MLQARFLCPFCLGVCTIAPFDPGRQGVFVCEVFSRFTDRYVYCEASNSCDDCQMVETCKKLEAGVRITLEDLDVPPTSRWCRPNYHAGNLEV